MRRSLLLALAALGLSAPAVARDVWVNGYYRADGTYVPGHYRSEPDSNPYNNYNTYPNVNPYNGRQGTVRPYQMLPVPQYRPYVPPPAYPVYPTYPARPATPYTNPPLVLPQCCAPLSED